MTAADGLCIRILVINHNPILAHFRIPAVAWGGAIMLRGEGAWADGTALAVAYDGGVYADRAGVAAALTRGWL